MNGTKNARTGIYMILTVMLVSITRRLPGTKRISERLSTGMTTLVLAAVVLLVAAGTVSALPACPAPGNTPIGASCELDQNWPAVPAGQYGYQITANNVVIDGKGFTLTGTMPAACGGGEAAPCACSGVINNDFDNVVVKDMKITGFCTGVAMGDNAAPDVVNMTVVGCEIHNCGEPTGTTHGVHLVRANDCTITKNTIYEIDGTGAAAGCGGGGNGIFGYGADMPHGKNNIVTCNHLYDNTKSGMFTKKCCDHWTISNNNASANGQGGIAPMCKKSGDCTIEYNIMTENGAFGYTSQANRNTLRFNTITNNGNFGIQFKSDQFAAPPYGLHNKAYNNTICGHNAADIRQDGDDGGTNKEADNTCDMTMGAVQAGACPWRCDELADVYYDYDDDSQLVGGNDYYSGPWAADACMKGMCPTLMPVGSCNNPGLFNSSAAATPHCDYEDGKGYDVCILTPGQDPNDCCPVPEVATFLLFGLGLVGLVGYIKTRKD